MNCPTCGEKLKGFNTLFIDRWNSITCPVCKAMWNRKLDIQFFLVYVLGLFVLFPAVITLGVLGINKFFVFLTLVSGVFILLITDIKTVKLHPVKKREGTKGALLGDKFID